MVRIEKDKLIIEIPCCNQNPMQLLTEYQLGIVGAIHSYAYVDMSGIPDEGDLSLQSTIQRLTFLLNQMMLTIEQSDTVGVALLQNKKALEFVNGWPA